MMKLIKMILIGVMSVVVLVACTEKAQEQNTSQDEVANDAFTLSGKYTWQFDLGPSKQVSTHTFYPDKIEYKMTGLVYSTEYTMNKISFDGTENKWIGQDENGHVYVLFFKKLNQGDLSIYKKKCKQGLEQALQFKKPAEDATTDHGWNTYTTQAENKDVLPINGVYAPVQQGKTIHFSDAVIQIGDTAYKKITHHSGERRWVGEHNQQYLVLFYDEKKDNTLSVNYEVFDDLKNAYTVKHNTQWHYKKEK